MVKQPAWARASDEELLGLRFRDLGLSIAGTPLEGRVARLHEELAARGIRLRPHVWLSSEWFTPEGVPGFALPFYLAHPRLIRLERTQVHEAEDDGETACLRLIRHEAGHAVDQAFRLHFRRSWRAIFGRYSTPYRRHYAPRPQRMDFVRNLPRWYAQSHPAEDFAETFAVWLDPRSRWRRRYAGTGALDKLERLDAMLAGIAGKRPLVRCREETESLAKLDQTLGRHYARKNARLEREPDPPYERELRRTFPAEGRGSAAAFLSRMRKRLSDSAMRRSAVDAYSIAQVLDGMILRTRELGLRVPPSGGTSQAALGAMVDRTLHALRRGRYRIAR